MAFPQTPLPIAVDISLDNSTWTDITSDVRAEQQIQISRGRSAWAQQTEASRCSFTLDNNTGKYSPRNPSSPYFGKIGRNTPCRVSVLTGLTTLSLPFQSDADFIQTPDVAALDVTGDIDIRLDAELANWYLADAALGAGNTDLGTKLIGKYAETGNQRSWALYVQNGKFRFIWSEDGGPSTGYTVTGAKFLPVPASGRLAIRVAVDVNNGAGGWTLNFYTADSMDDPWTLFETVTFTGATTSFFASTTPLRIGDCFNGEHGVIEGYNAALGHVYKVEIRNGIGGTVVASPDFTAQTSGVTSFVDGAGRTWTVNGQAEITNRKVRFVGEISSWSPVWDTGGKDVTTRVEASGIIRRLTQGAIAAKSPMRREFTNPFRTGLVAYWPLEDADGATRFASAFPNHPPINFTQSIAPAAYSAWTASAPLPTITTGKLAATIPAYPATGFMFLRFFLAVPASGVASTQRLVTINTTGTAAKWTLSLNTAGALTLQAFDSDDASLFTDTTSVSVVNGIQASVGVELTQSGSNINTTIFIYDITHSTIDVATAFSETGTLNSRTVGIATRMTWGEDGLLNGTAIGHIAIANDNAAYASTSGALVGWAGESATARVHRLGVEEDFYSYSSAGGSERMGVQAQDTVMNLLNAAGDVDEGILTELRYLLGTRLVHLGSMYNAPVIFSMDYSGDDGLVAPLAPVDDDQQVTNDVTVVRSDGSSARVTQSTGALSTNPPPSGIGLYDTSYTLNLYTDGQPAQHAGWRLHLGTWDEARLPQVTVDLANAPSSIEAASVVDVGSRMQITNPPGWLPPDVIDLLVLGYSEVMDQFTWTITHNCVPARPLTVAVRNDLALGRRDTAGSQLAAAVSSTAASVDALSTLGPLWTSAASDSPYDLKVGGEVMTVTAPGGLVNANPFFDTNTAGWAATNGALTWDSSVVAPHPAAKASAKITPTGGTFSVLAGANTAAGTFNAGSHAQATGWVYSPTGWAGGFQTQINWFNSSGTYITTTGGTNTSVPAGFTQLTDVHTAPANADRGQVLIRQNGTPSASDTWNAWAVRLTRLSASAVQDEFGRTLTDTWGSADTGQVWTNSGGAAADYDVLSGYGRHINPSVSVGHHSVIAASSADFDVYCDIAVAALSTGASQFAGIIARYTDLNNLYESRVEFTTANAIILSVRKRVAAVETLLATFTTAFTNVAATFMRVRFQGAGTLFRAKVWAAGTVEPSDWEIEVTDTSISATGSLGVKSVRNAGNTNTNSDTRFDNFEVVNPQTFSVARSVNGVTKAQAAGTPVNVAQPAVRAL